MEEEIPLDDLVDETTSPAKALEKKTPIYYEESDTYKVFDSSFSASVSEEVQS